MERRLQIFNGDTVLEITDSINVKHRFSEKTLIARKEILAEMRQRLDEEISGIEDRLADIQNEKDKLK